MSNKKDEEKKIDFLDEKESGWSSGTFPVFNLTIPAPGEVVEGFSGRENGGDENDEDMGPPPKPTDEELAQAEEVYQRAVEMYNNDEFLDAVDLFFSVC